MQDLNLFPRALAHLIARALLSRLSGDRQIDAANRMLDAMHLETLSGMEDIPDDDNTMMVNSSLQMYDWTSMTDYRYCSLWMIGAWAYRSCRDRLLAKQLIGCELQFSRCYPLSRVPMAYYSTGLLILRPYVFSFVYSCISSSLLNSWFL